jgi:pimeloyl-ACP methyl ester carboxylesterase
MVPFAHMQELNRLSNAPAIWVEFPNSGHMDAYVTDEIIYWRALRDFWIQSVRS